MDFVILNKKIATKNRNDLMNANDNFEKKDLNDSNVTPISESVEDSSTEQNKEETQEEQEVTLQEPSDVSEIEAKADVETENKQEDVSISDDLNQDDEPVVETKVDAEGSVEAEAEEAEVEETKVEEVEVEEAKVEEAEVKEAEVEETEVEETEDKAATEKVEDTTTAPEEEVKSKTEDTPVDTETEEIPKTETEEDSTEEEDSEEEDSEEDHKEEVTERVVDKRPKLMVPLTFEEIVSKLRELAGKDKFSRKELDKFQGLYFSEIRKEADEQKLQFMNDGGKEEDFAIKESELHAEGKILLQTLAEKRKKLLANEEKVKEKNMERKLAIIEEVRELTESPEDFNKKHNDFKSLQQEWRDIKLVPHGKDHELWQAYQEQVEKFYDIVHLHNEYRDYDFKKNLESKMGLCEAAEKLTVEEDIVSAFHQLQKLHNDWRDIGPVARKDRELIWQRFKEASAEINKRYQTRIESLKAQEGENFDKKTAICEELEAIDISTLKSTREWETKTREVLNLQSEWRLIGYAPRKVNAKIFQRYRATCDSFFKSKNEYYQSIRGELDENLKKKTELCERAEAMRESQDWKNTTSDMIAIQREWKEIGMVPRRSSSSIWKRFIAACDHFFEQKNLHSKSIRQEEVDNLEKKREVTESIKNIDHALTTEDAMEKLKELMSDWQAIGFVPFKDKNTAYKEFTEATDSIYSRLNIDKSERKLETFKSNISELTKSDRSRGQVFYEREKLMRQFEKMKSELQTYENNIGFLSSSSKKGNVLLDDMNSKIEKIKAELDLIVKKVDAIDENL